MLEQPHRRYNPLTREWIVVSPHRTRRPWQGQVDPPPTAATQPYDPTCYLCPGNERAGGRRNPDYADTLAFDNDYPGLLSDASPAAVDTGGLLVARSERGICRVLCFSPRHDLTLSTMPVPALRTVVDAWTDQYQTLGAVDWVRHVQIFENRGPMMGASNPHPHGQIWATETVPDAPAKEQLAQGEWNGCLLCDYLALERERVVLENDAFIACVPFWATWPFETLVLPRRHRASLEQLAPLERDALADVLSRLTRKYDRLFDAPFPYTMGIHQRPTDGEAHPEWHLHAHFYPPLLRSATVRKFMVGFEMLGTPQRDLTPEAAAARLRDA